jgi:Fe2+ transport system protein FeoA
MPGADDGCQIVLGIALYLLYFGVVKGEEVELRSHARVSSDPLNVTGGGSFEAV